MFSDDVNSYFNAKWERDHILMLLEIRKWVNLDKEHSEYLDALIEQEVIDYLDSYPAEIRKWRESDV